MRAFRQMRFPGWSKTAMCLAVFAVVVATHPYLSAALGALNEPSVYLYRGTILKKPSYEKEDLWLRTRRQAQIETLSQFSVFHDFKFSDRLPDSGITFSNRIVEDAGKQYKSIHYDHGTGLAVADIDQDGRVDLYFVSQLGTSELWRNVGGGKFDNVTGSAGVTLENRVGVSASFADVDNDGDPDLFVTTVRTGNVLFENVGKGRFANITERAGLAYSGHSSAALFFDYDLDGWLDLFLANVGHYTTDKKGPGGYYLGMGDGFRGHLHSERSEGCILYRNLGGRRFVNITDQAGLRDFGWSGDASFADLNQDSFPDLYVLNMQGNDHFYESVQGKSFVDKTDLYFPKTPWGSMGIKFFDFDNDGLIDLFVTDMHSDMSDNLGYVRIEEEKKKSVMQWTPEVLVGHEKSIWGNAFYRNTGRGKFEEISDRIGVENYWPWGVSAGDLNADGYTDLFITAGMNYPFRYGINSLLLNNLGRAFLDSEFILGVEPRKGERTMKPWFEVDCFGEDENHRDCVGQEGKLTVMGSLASRSSVIADLDDDGDLDIVTNEFNAEPQVLLSDLAQRKKIRFIKIGLVGTKSNRDGLGALVTVTAKGLKITQQQDGSSGYLSHSVLPLYFGLGESDQIDRIEVRWPSRHRQSIEKPAELNTLIRIVEGS